MVKIDSEFVGSEVIEHDEMASLCFAIAFTEKAIEKQREGSLGVGL